MVQFDSSGSCRLLEVLCSVRYLFVSYLTPFDETRIGPTEVIMVVLSQQINPSARMAYRTLADVHAAGTKYSRLANCILERGDIRAQGPKRQREMPNQHSRCRVIGYRRRYIFFPE